MQFHRSLELRQIDLAGDLSDFFFCCSGEGKRKPSISHSRISFPRTHSFFSPFFIRLRHLISLSRTIFLAALDQGKKPSSNLLANLAVHNHQPFPPSFSLISCIETEPFFRYFFFWGGGFSSPPFWLQKQKEAFYYYFPFFLFFFFSFRL